MSVFAPLEAALNTVMSAIMKALNIEIPTIVLPGLPNFGVMDILNTMFADIFGSSRDSLYTLLNAKFNLVNDVLFDVLLNTLLPITLPTLPKCTV